MVLGARSVFRLSAVAVAIALPLDARDGRSQRATVGVSPASPATAARLTAGAESAEWPGMVKRLGSTALRHPGGARVLVCSPDGKLLVSAGSADILLWDADTYRRVRRLPCSDVAAVAFSPDGKTLVSGHSEASVRGWDPHVRVWDLEGGRLRHDLVGHRDPVWKVAVSPDGRMAASIDRGGRIRLWNLTTGKLAREVVGPAQYAAACFFSDDSRELKVAFRGGDLVRWNVATGRKLGSSSVAQSEPFLTHDGRYALTTDGETLVVREIATGVERVRTAKLDLNQYHPHCVSPDGSRLAIRRGRAVEVHDLTRGGSVTIGLELHGLFSTLCITPDNRRLFVIDSDGSQVRGWDLERKSQIAVGDEADTIALELAFSPDGRWLAASGNDRDVNLRLWDMDTLEQVGGFSTTDRKSKRLDPPWSFHITSLRFSPDARELFGAVDSEVRVWSIPDGKLARRIQVGGTCSAVPLPDGKHLATGFWADNPDVVIWDAESGLKVRSLHDHWQPVLSVAASPLGSVLASGSRDRTVVLWDLQTWERRRVLEGPTEEVQRVAVSADGARVAAGTESSAQLWDAETGKSQLRLALPRFWRRAIEFSPDAKILAVGDTELRLFDAMTGRELKRVQPLERPVASLAFAPDSRRLAMASWDGTIWLWDVKRLLNSGNK